MKRTVFPIVLLAMMQLPLFAASPVSSVASSIVYAANHSNMPRMRAMAMDKSDFKLLRSLLKEESFENGRIKMIRIAYRKLFYLKPVCRNSLAI